MRMLLAALATALTIAAVLLSLTAWRATQTEQVRKEAQEDALRLVRQAILIDCEETNRLRIGLLAVIDAAGGEQSPVFQETARVALAPVDCAVLANSLNGSES